MKQQRISSVPEMFSNLLGHRTASSLILMTVLISVIDNNLAIKCYKCAVTVEKHNSYQTNLTITTPMCSKFDESQDFEVDCPYSTMCLKTISALHLQNGQLQEAITRGCAQQKDTTQVFRNRQWQQEHSVQEVYTEGCKRVENNNLAGTIITHCYCRGDLCNSSKKLGPKYGIDGMAVIFVIFIAKYALF